MSDALPDAPTPRTPEVAREPWSDFAAASAWPEAGPATPALSHRHDGTLIHVRVAPPGLAAYRALAVDAPMPDGSRVIAWHEAPTGSLLGGFLLEKRAGAWSALELDAHGGVIPGDRTACVRCHDMAPTDHLFGLPSAAPVPPAAPGSRGAAAITSAAGLEPSLESSKPDAR